MYFKSDVILYVQLENIVTSLYLYFKINLNDKWRRYYFSNLIVGKM